MPRPPSSSPAPLPSRLRRYFLFWPVATVVLQVISGLVRGLAEAKDHTGSLGLAVLVFIAIVCAIWALVRAAQRPRVSAVLPRVSSGFLFLTLATLLLASVLLIGLASEWIGTTFPVTPDCMLTVAGLGFIGCGGAWGLWCTANLLWADEPRSLLDRNNSSNDGAARETGSSPVVSMRG